MEQSNEPYSKQYYTANKDKILSSYKASSDENKKLLLKAKGFPDFLSTWVRINKETITITLKSNKDLIDFLNDCTQYQLANKIEDLSDKCDTIGVPYKLTDIKYANTRLLLKSKGYSESMSPWTKINKGNVTVTFKKPIDFYEFLSVRQLMLDDLDALNEVKVVVDTPKITE